MRRAALLAILLSVGVASYILGQVIAPAPQKEPQQPSGPAASASQAGAYPTQANDGWARAQAIERSARAQPYAAPPQPPMPYSAPPATPPAPLPGPVAPSYPASPYGSTSYPPVPPTLGEAKQPTNQELLAKKVQELNNLRVEVDRLRRLTGTVQQVVVKLRMVEISLTKLRELKLDPKVCDPALLERLQSGQLGAVVSADDSRALDRLIEHLRKEKIAGILAEPSLAMYCGHPASFHAGGEFPLHTKTGNDRDSIQYKRFGTEVDCVPLALGGNRVRLDLKFRCSHIDDAHSVTVNDVQIPSLRMKEVNTAAEMDLGQTMILHAATSQREEVEQRGDLDGARRFARTEDLLTLVLVTPTTIEAASQRQTAQRRPVAAPAVAPLPQAAAEPGPVVLVECRVLDIDMTKLRALGVDFERLLDMDSKPKSPVAAPGPAASVSQQSGGQDADPLAGLVVSNSEAAKGFIEMLRKEQIAEVLACPKLMTLSGQPAQLQLGHQVDVPDHDHPSKIGQGFAGTEISVLPRVTGDGRIEMQLKLGVSQQGEPYGYRIRGKPLYVLERMHTETTLTLEDGQTIIAGGLRTRSETPVRKPDVPDKDGDAEAPAPAYEPATGERYEQVTLERKVEETNRYVLLTARVVRPGEEPAKGAAGAYPSTAAPREANVPPPNGRTLE